MRPGAAQLLCRSIPLVVVSCSLPVIGFAAEYTTSAQVAPGVTYTDNVCLSKNNKEGEWVALVTPSGSIQGKGKKADFSVNGSVQLNSLTDSTLENANCAGGGGFGDRQQFAPNINARGSAVLIDDWLKINANARANQNEISPFRGGQADSLNGNGNTNTFYRYSLSPVLTRRLKDFATYTLSYNYNAVINTADAVSNSTSDSWSTSLDGGEATKVSWSLFGNYREVEFDDNQLFVEADGSVVPRENTVLRSSGLRLGYQINRRWQATGSLGYEWNDIQTNNDDDTDGLAWSVGARWTPTPRTTVNMSIGDRFFGKTPELDISHVHKRSVFSASYRKTITFDRDILTEGNEFNQNIGNFSAQNAQSPIIDERYTLGYSYNGRRATISFIGSHSDQTQEDNGQKSTFDNVALTYSPRLSRHFSVSGTLSWNKAEPRSQFGGANTAFSDTTESWRTVLSVSRPLNDRMSVMLNYTYTDQQSDIALNEYQENRIMATLNIRL